MFTFQVRPPLEKICERCKSTLVSNFEFFKFVNNNNEKLKEESSRQIDAGLQVNNDKVTIDTESDEPDVTHIVQQSSSGSNELAVCSATTTGRTSLPPQTATKPCTVRTKKTQKRRRMDFSQNRAKTGKNNLQAKRRKKRAKVWKCDFCPNIYLSNQTRKRHIKDNHSDPETPQLQKIRLNVPDQKTAQLKINLSGIGIIEQV